MELNKCIEFFNLNTNYTTYELQSNYKRLLLKYHKDNDNDNDINFYQKLKNYYNILLCNIESKNTVNSNDKIHNITSNYNNNLNQLIPITNNISNKNNLINKNNINNEYVYNNEYFYIDPINLELNLTYEEAYNGCSKPIIIERIINNYNSITKENENYYMKIPRGIDNNEIINITNKGNCYNNNYGDIKVIIKLLDHTIFTRKGLDLHIKKNISLKESLLGFEFDIYFLNDKKYKINNNTILLNKTKIIRNLGFIRDTFKGNLIINFNIIFPNTLTNDQKDKLSYIL